LSLPLDAPNRKSQQDRQNRSTMTSYELGYPAVVLDGVPAA
jgi:hypothetical protein